MATYTKEQKADYFKTLRARWSDSKKLAETDEIKAIVAECQAQGLHVSAYGVCFAWSQMRAQGLDGVPVIDAKTFDGWKSAGFMVRKGEHAKLEGITWIRADVKNEAEGAEDAGGYAYPKTYKLFHRSQVEPLTA